MHKATVVFRIDCSLVLVERHLMVIKRWKDRDSGSENVPDSQQNVCLVFTTV